MIAVLASAVAVIAIISAVALAMLWRSAASDVSSLQAEKDAAIRIANEKPDLAAIAYAVFGSRHWDGDSDTVTATINGTGGDDLDVFMERLGFSPAVIERMGKTRALDGTQQAEGDHANVTWTYHPDDGLQAVFEATG